MYRTVLNQQNQTDLVVSDFRRGSRSGPFYNNVHRVHRHTSEAMRVITGVPYINQRTLDNSQLDRSIAHQWPNDRWLKAVISISPTYISGVQLSICHSVCGAAAQWFKGFNRATGRTICGIYIIKSFEIRECFIWQRARHDKSVNQ